MTASAPETVREPLEALRALSRGAWRVGACGSDGTTVVRAEGRALVLELVGDVLRGLHEQGLVEIGETAVRVTRSGRERLRRALLERCEAALAGDVPVQGIARTVKSARVPAGSAVRDGALGWLASRSDAGGRPLVDPVELAAGERLAADFERSMLRQRVTSGWNPAASALRDGGFRSASEIPDVAIDARRRLRLALDAVGSDLATVLWDVCCEDVRLEELERRRGWPKRSGRIVLVIALRRLASHYGMSAAAEGPDRGIGRIRHWGVDGYRPTVDGTAPESR